MKRITVSELKAIESLHKNNQFFISQPKASFVFLAEDSIIIYTTQELLKVYSFDGTVLHEVKVSVKQINNMSKIGDLVAIANKASNQLILADLMSGKISYHEGHLRPITDLTVFQNSFVTSSKDLTIRLWQINKPINAMYQTNRKHLKFPIALKGHKGSINCLAVFGKFLISGSQDNSVICWTDKNEIWTQLNFGDNIIKIVPCPLSSQIIVFTAGSMAHFINIKTIVKKKMEIRATLNMGELEYPFYACELDESFLFSINSKSILFIQVNLSKIMHEVHLQKQTQITHMRCKGRCIFLGEIKCGVNVLKI